MDCYANGRKYHTAHFIIYAQAGEGPARIGLTVSRKVGNAVARVRLKRLLRENIRVYDGELGRLSRLVFVARHNAADLAFSEIGAEIFPVLRRLDQ